MKLSRFVDRIKIEVPNIGTPGITDDGIKALVNEAVNRVNLLTKVYRGYTDFNILAEQQIYSLSVVIPTFMGMAKPGVFFQDSSGNWQPVYPKTLAWISKVNPGFLNSTSAALPKWYWQEGNDIGFDPKPSTAIAGGCRVYHLKKATDMTNDDNYPFTNLTVPVTEFEALDDAILAYCRWKLAPAFGNVSDIDLREREFLKECRKGAKQINRRPDLYMDAGYGLTI